MCRGDYKNHTPKTLHSTVHFNHMLHIYSLQSYFSESEKLTIQALEGEFPLGLEGGGGRWRGTKKKKKKKLKVSATAFQSRRKRGGNRGPIKDQLSARAKPPQPRAGKSSGSSGSGAGTCKTQQRERSLKRGNAPGSTLGRTILKSSEPAVCQHLDGNLSEFPKVCISKWWAFP